MKRLTCQIKIGKFEFDFVVGVTIESSWQNLTDTAKITLPRNLKWKDKLLKDEIKRGDQVEIYLGYDFVENLEFKGYVSQVKSEVPVVVECEDEMWKLKQKTITQAWREVKLSALVSAIAGSGTSVVGEIDLGPFRINKASAASVMAELRGKYGIVSFFRDGVLFVGFPYAQTEDKISNINYEEQVIESGLQYTRKDDVSIRVRAVSILPDGNTIEVETGDAEGETHSLHFYNVQSTELKKLADEQIDRLKYEGYRGEFITFGDPFIRHSEKVNLTSFEYRDRGGTYLVDAVTTTFGDGGFRRRVKLGPRS